MTTYLPHSSCSFMLKFMVSHFTPFHHEKYTIRGSFFAIKFTLCFNKHFRDFVFAINCLFIFESDVMSMKGEREKIYRQGLKWTCGSLLYQEIFCLSLTLSISLRGTWRKVKSTKMLKNSDMCIRHKIKSQTQ